MMDFASNEDTMVFFSTNLMIACFLFFSFEKRSLNVQEDGSDSEASYHTASLPAAMSWQNMFFDNFAISVDPT